MTRLGIVAFVVACSFPGGIAGAQGAQVGGVAESGLQQGEVAVSVRSEVRLAIKGIRATLSDRLNGMTREVSAQMPAVRGCYNKLVAKRPATVGGLRAEIVLGADSRRVRVDVTEVDGSDRELTACIEKLLRALPFREVERPAAAEVTLSFDNTRARGQAQLEEHQAEFSVDVSRDTDGVAVGQWATEGGAIVFTAKASGESGPDLVGGVLRGLRAGFSGFLDCHRRAGRKGMNPVGEIELSVRASRNGELVGSAIRVAIQDTQRTPGCVEKAIGRVDLGRDSPVGTIKLTVRFAQ